MKTVSATIFGLLVCLCSQVVGQDAPIGHQFFYGGDCHEWELKTQLLIMDLKDSNINLNAATDATLGTTLLTGAQLSALDTGVGVDASLFHNSKSGRRWELRSTFASFNRSFQLTGDIADVFHPGFPAGTELSFGGANGSVRGIGDKIDRLDFFGVEFNGHRAIAPGVSLIAGPKFVNLDDQLSVFSTRPVGAGAILQTGNEFRTTNRMFGGHVGFNLNLKLFRNLSINGTMKAGYYINDSKFNLVNANTLSAAVTSTTTTQSFGSAAGEFGGSVTWELFPNVVALEAGYHAFWLDNVARAYGQVFHTGTGLATDTTFFQGLHFGLIYRR